jgi:hypothetical protein
VGSGTALPEGISPYFAKFFGNLQTDINYISFTVAHDHFPRYCIKSDIKLSQAIDKEEELFRDNNTY